MKTIDVNGKSVAIGLDWSRKKTAEYDLSEDKSYGVVFEISGWYQIGYADEKLKNSYSGSAMLAMSVTASTIYIEQLDDDLFWFAAADPGLVRHGGDKIGTRDDLEALLFELSSSMGKKDKFICYLHPDCNFEHGSFDNFELHMGDFSYVVDPAKAFNNTTKIHLLSGSFFARHGVGLSLATLAICIAGYFVWDYFEQARLTVERERQELVSQSQTKQEIETMRQLRIAQAIKEARELDLMKPRIPRSVVDVCASALNRYGFFIGGWVLENMACGASANFQYRRETGTLASFSLNDPAIVQLPDLANDKVKFNLPVSFDGLEQLPPLPKRADLHDVLSVYQHRDTVLERLFVLKSVSLKRRAIEYTHPTTGSAEAVLPNDTTERLWYRTTFNVTGSGLETLPYLVQEAPGLALDSLAFTFNKNGSLQWTASMSMVSL
jgi:hypothetical protein